MSSFTRLALTSHTQLDVSGEFEAIAPDTETTPWTLDIRDIGDLPVSRKTVRPALPVMFPVFFEAGSGTEVPSATAGAGNITQTQVFLCLVESPRRFQDLSYIGPKTIDVRDAYLIAMATSPDLFGRLSNWATVAVELGILEWGEQEWSGFVARHTWQTLL